MHYLNFLQPVSRIFIRFKMKYNRKSWYVNRWSCHTLLCESSAKIDGAYRRPIWFFESTQFDKHHIGNHDSFIWRILFRQRAIKWNAPWDIIALIKSLISLAWLTNGMEYSYVILQSTRGWKANGVTRDAPLSITHLPNMATSALTFLWEFLLLLSLSTLLPKGPR